MPDPLGRRGVFEWILRRDRSAARDVDAELEAHLALRIESLRAAGLSEAEARAEAVRRFGNLEETRQALTAGRRRREQSVQLRDRFRAVLVDLRGFLRQTRRAPGFTGLWLATLGVSVGLATAVFALVNGVLLRPLPYPEPDRLVALWSVDSLQRSWPVVSADDWDDWRRESRSFAAVAVYRSFRGSVAGTEQPLRATITTASPELFDVIRPQFVWGRSFTPAETADRVPVVVLSEGLWRRMGAERAPGWRLSIDGVEREVTGVVAAGQVFPSDADAWVPYRHRQVGGAMRNNVNWFAVARVRSGVSLDQASDDLARVAAGIRASDPAAIYSWGVGVRPLRDTITGDSRSTLMLLQGAVLVVLLIACANLASASLARGLVRTREVAVRMAIGAGRGQVIRQIIAEHLLLAAAGGLLGGALAWLAVRTAVLASASQLPRAEDVRLDPRVLLFAAALAGLAGLLTGVLPALQAARAAPHTILGGGRGTGGSGTSTPGRILVGLEVALALILVTGAGLLIESFRNVLRQPLGFATAGVVAADVVLAGPRYRGNQAALDDYWARTLAAVRAAPGVAAAGVANWAPMSTAGKSFVEIEGRESQPGADPQQEGAGYRAVGEGYFATLMVPLLRGRDFTVGDDSTVPRVAIISRSMAERFWPGQDPLGRRLRTPSMEALPAGVEAPWLTVVGVVGDLRHWGYENEIDPTVFVPWRQVPLWSTAMTLVVRSTGPVVALVQTVRDRALAVDPAIPVDVVPLAERASQLIAPRRFTMALLSAVGVLALGLAGLGVYGVLSLAVAQRRRELAVRSALGADSARLVRSVVADGARLVGSGLVAGLAGALLLGSVVQSLVFGVGPRDPQVTALAAAVVAGAGLLAAWRPARRAARVPPMEVLRGD